jgi:superfamily II DNA/RNA helicase
MDRMLDMGFGIQIDKILKFMTLPRQTLLFSATMPQEIIKLANKYTKSPERISVGSTTTPIDKITQEVLRISPEEKYATLTQQLDKRTGSIIVFVKTKHGADRLAQKLTREKHSAEAIHGDLRQNKRDRVIRDFREKKHRILVATDVAARGLDIPHIEHVINYDLPQCPEDYIHRIGRTARAGAEGSAVCLVTPDDGSKWNAIHRLMHPNEKAPMQDRSAPRGNRNKPGGKPFRFKRQGGDSRSEGRSEGRARPEGRGYEGKKREDSQARPDGQRRAEGRSEGRARPEGRSFEGKSRPEGRTFEGKKFEGQRRDGGQARPDGQRRPDNRGNSSRPQNGDRPRHRAA